MVDQLIKEFSAISSDTDRYSAILELIDNSYTSWIQKEGSYPLNGDINFNSNADSLVYSDNAAGMDITKMKTSLKPGDTTAQKSHKGISL